jgi:hypothetical protein
VEGTVGLWGLVPRRFDLAGDLRRVSAADGGAVGVVGQDE